MMLLVSTNQFTLITAFSQVLNSTYHSEGRVLNGIEMSPYIRNQTFRLPTSEVSISAGGLRLVNVTGEFFDSKTGQYTVDNLFFTSNIC